MDKSCKKLNCEGIENYCTDSSHAPTYFCNCREARKKHSGHRVKLIDLEYITESLSKVQEDCAKKKFEFITQSYESIEVILQTLKARCEELAPHQKHLVITKGDKCIRVVIKALEDHNSELDTVIEQCTEAKEKLNSPQNRLEALNKYIQPQHIEKAPLLLDSKLDQKKYFDTIQEQVDLFTSKPQKRPERPKCTQIESSALHKKFEQFLLNLKRKNPMMILTVRNFIEDPESFPFLKLEFADMKDEIANFFIELLPSSGVKGVHFSYNKLGDKAAEALGTVLPVSIITRLELVNNKIGQKGAKALGDALPNCLLIQLELGENKLGEAGAKALASGLAGSKLNTLGLGFNSIGDGGMKALANALPKSSLELVRLDSNEIGKEGAKTLGSVLPMSKVTTIGLNWNSIDDEGAMALACALTISPLTQLNLLENRITEFGKYLLKEAEANSKRTNVYV